MKTIDSLNIEICREVLQGFWDSQTQVVATSRGVAIAMPLMYPDGWQVEVLLKSLSPTRLIITDNCKTLMRLTERGLNFESGQTGELFDDRKKTFELMQDGYELYREIKLPLDGLDVQLFAESLVSISHLIYRHEPYSPTENVADRTLLKVFGERQITPKKNLEIEGKIEKKIRVDYYLSGNHPMAFQVVRRRGILLPFMEQWGFRWRDIQQRQPSLLRGMIYDPDKQDWDDTALDIGRSVCDLFCPYFETQKINAFVDKLMFSN